MGIDTTVQIESKTLEFYELFEQLISAMTETSNINVPQIEEKLRGLCKLLRISKGITRLYRNFAEEDLKHGDVMKVYDDGRECRLVHSVRAVTNMLTIAVVGRICRPRSRPLRRKSSEGPTL